jgi:hypothetical protein
MLGRFNDLIPLAAFPARLEDLDMQGFEYYTELQPNVFPSTLEYLMFYRKFNQPLEPNMFQSSLKVLYLGDDSNLPIGDNIFPLSLKKLVLRKEYAHPLPIIHSGCTILTELLYSALPAAIFTNVFRSCLSAYVGIQV